jgi:hypothetical protein
MGSFLAGLLDSLAHFPRIANQLTNQLTSLVPLTNSKVSSTAATTMRNQNSRRQQKNRVQNVRVLDETAGSDSVQVQRYLDSYTAQEGQIRVVCSYRQEAGFGTVATSFSIGYDSLTGTDDFTSFATQYLEFRVRAIRFEIIDLFATPGAVNFWATTHVVGGTVPSGIEDVVDRPDSRSIAPGDGKVTLHWLAHGIPEMAFQSVTQFDNLGGLVNYLGSTSTAQGGRYSIIAKFVVDFRGKR